MLFLNDSDAVFDSRNPFASNKPDYSNRQYGGNVSGPINKHASFFLDYNERDITNNAITNAIYLDPTTLAARSDQHGRGDAADRTAPFRRASIISSAPITP